MSAQGRPKRELRRLATGGGGLSPLARRRCIEDRMRLSLDSLVKVAPDVSRPAYEPGNVGIGIVHLGIGAFHRAHQAIYTDAALGPAGGDWGICGVSL